MNKDELKELLKDVIAPIAAIERKVGIPKNVLQQSLKGRRDLPKEWVLRLREFVEKKQYIGLRRKKRMDDEKKQVVLEVKKEVVETKVKIEEKNDKSEDWSKLSRVEQMKRLRG